MDALQDHASSSVNVTGTCVKIDTTLTQGRSRSVRPEVIARETLLAAIPPGVPPSFTAITSASSAGKGRAAVITATLTMFDGAPATVRLKPWAFGWSHQWMSLPGGAICCESGQWERVADDEEPAAETLDLFDHPTTTRKSPDRSGFIEGDRG